MGDLGGEDRPLLLYNTIRPVRKTFTSPPIFCICRGKSQSCVRISSPAYVKRSVRRAVGPFACAPSFAALQRCGRLRNVIAYHPNHCQAMPPRAAMALPFCASAFLLQPCCGMFEQS